MVSSFLRVDQLISKHQTALRYLLWLLCLVLLSGCGGGGSSGTRAALAPGIVTLPAGSALLATDLTVTGAMGSAPVGADGKFTLTQPDTGSALVMAQDKQDRVVLLGRVDPASGIGEISAKETAVTLLYYATGAWSLPHESWSQALALIRNSPQAAQLESVIAARVAADPGALSSGDAQIKAALTQAVDGLITPGTIPTRGVQTNAGPARQAQPQALSRVSITRTPSTIVINSPSGNATQSGLEARLNTNGDGIVLTNHFRRHSYYFLYQTSYDDANGTNHPIAPWKEISKGYISSINGFYGVLGSIADGAIAHIPGQEGHSAYVPYDTDPIDVPVSPTDAKTCYYTLVSVGPGVGQVIPNDLIGNSLSATWEDARFKMNALTFVVDFLMPVVFPCITHDRINSLTNSQLTEACVDIVKDVGDAIADAGQFAGMGDYTGALLTLAKAITTNGTLHEKLGNLISTRLLKGFSTSETGKMLGAFGDKLTGILEIFDIVMGVYDLGCIGHDLAVSNQYEEWTLATAWPKAHLYPASATLNNSETLILHAYTGDKPAAWPDPLSSGLHYHWTNTANAGSLAIDTKGRARGAESFDTDSCQTTYTAQSSGGGKDTITVEVFSGTGANKRSLGTGQCAVTVAFHTTATLQYWEGQFTPITSSTPTHAHGLVWVFDVPPGFPQSAQFNTVLHTHGHDGVYDNWGLPVWNPITEGCTFNCLCLNRDKVESFPVDNTNDKYTSNVNRIYIGFDNRKQLGDNQRYTFNWITPTQFDPANDTAWAQIKSNTSAWTLDVTWIP